MKKDVRKLSVGNSRPASFLTIVALSVSAVTSPTWAQQATASPGTIALVGGQLVDGYEVPPIHHAAVIIQGDRIVAAGPAAEIPIPPGATIINTAGRTMMPGLIDVHAHLIIVGHGNYPDWFPWFERNEELVYQTAAQQMLSAGVTTAVDLGAPLSLLRFRDRVARGEVPGPRILASGPWITRTPWDFVPQELRKAVRSPEEAATEARRLIAAGVDVIKTWSGITEEDFRAIAAVTRPAGKRIHCHVYATEAVWDAIRGGCDVLQHAGSGGTVPAYPAELVAEIAMRGIPVVQTIAHRIWVYEATVAFPERLYHPELIASFPPEMWAQVDASFTKHDFHRRSYFRRTPREIRLSRTAARQFIAAGAVNVMGTDSGTPLNFHREAAWREMSALVDAGMSPIEAISAATKVAAEAIGRSADLGTIEPGKLADIIVVDGNPLVDINVLAHVTDVIKGGVIFKRDRQPTWRQPGAPATR